MSAAKARPISDTTRKAILIDLLGTRGQFQCQFFRAGFSTGIYWLDLTRRNGMNIITHYECSSATNLLEALERLAERTKSWGSK